MLISLMNTGLSSRLHLRKSSFVLSWSSATATRIQRELLNRTFQTSLPWGRNYKFQNYFITFFFLCGINKCSTFNFCNTRKKAVPSEILEISTSVGFTIFISFRLRTVLLHNLVTISIYQGKQPFANTPTLSHFDLCSGEWKIRHK